MCWIFSKHKFHSSAFSTQQELNWCLMYFCFFSVSRWTKKKKYIRLLTALFLNQWLHAKHSYLKLEDDVGHLRIFNNVNCSRIVTLTLTQPFWHWIIFCSFLYLNYINHHVLFCVQRCYPSLIKDITAVGFSFPPVTLHVCSLQNFIL